MKILLSTNIRDETNIVEWVDWHLHVVGVDHILIIDHLSNPPLRKEDFRSVATPHEIHILRREIGNKLDFMNIALRYAQTYEFEWSLHLDGDEYLYLRQDIHSFLKKTSPQTIVFSLPWILFGSNFRDHVSEIEQRKLLELYRRSADKFDGHVKSLFRPCFAVRAVTPHTYEFTVTPSESPPPPWHVDYEYEPLSLYVPKQCWNKTPHWETIPIFIAHFQTQAWNVFQKRRSRPRDDNARIRQLPFRMGASKGSTTFHQIGNQRENNLLCEKYTTTVPGTK